MRDENIKKGLVVFVMAVLLLPFIQACFPFITSGKLQGYFTNAGDIDLSWKNWFDGSYRDNKSNYLNDHVGFRPDLLRLNSQIDFSLFQKSNYGGTTPGKDDYLFYTDYIDAYYGRDAVDYNILKERMIKFKALQGALARRGKTLVLVYAPCKAWYCPEYIPSGMKEPRGSHNNYEMSVAIGDSLGIDQIDFNAWFLSMRKTTKEILYSRQGIHWTNYGAILGGDSIIKYIEHTRHIHMAHPQWNRVIHTTAARRPDNDMGDILNLIFPLVSDTFCYPELTYTNDTAITKPNCLYIGDSYNINLLTTGIIQNTDAQWELWFYWKKIFNDSNWDKDVEHPKIADYDWKTAIDNTDCIVMMYTPKNTKYLGDGFIEQAYDYYCGSKNPTKN